MRLDLLEAQAGVDWPISQFGDLSKRFDEWLKRGVMIELKEPPPPNDQNLIIAIENGLLPLHFQAEVGAYINSIRSSLDVLAMVLVKRHSLPIREDTKSAHIENAENKLRFKKPANSRHFMHFRRKFSKPGT